MVRYYWVGGFRRVNKHIDKGDANVSLASEKSEDVEVENSKWFTWAIALLRTLLGNIDIDHITPIDHVLLDDVRAGASIYAALSSGEIEESLFLQVLCERAGKWKQLICPSSL